MDFKKVMANVCNNNSTRMIEDAFENAGTGTSKFPNKIKLNNNFSSMLGITCRPTTRKTFCSRFMVDYYVLGGILRFGSIIRLRFGSFIMFCGSTIGPQNVKLPQIVKQHFQ
jgi:hypothetical protein